MLARALRTPLCNAARAVAPNARRALSTPGEHFKEVKDVKLKDVGAWVSDAKSDPRTEQAAKVSSCRLWRQSARFHVITDL
eukprot:3086735-Rhodomonas_salina.3